MSVEKIFVEVSGDFDTRDDAVRALERVADLLRNGHWQTSNPIGSNPQITIMSVECSDE